MKKLLLLALFGLSLTSCAAFRPHKMDVEQGNIFTQAEVNQLHKGMSLANVKNLMGSPVAINILNDNRVDYVYSNQPGYGKYTNKRVVCTFRNNQLIDIQQYNNDQG